MSDPGDKLPPTPAQSARPPAYQPTWDERMEDLRPYVGPAVVVGFLLFIGGVVAWYYTRTPAARPPPAGLPAAEIVEPPAGAGGDDETRLATYDRLVERQTELMRAQRGVDAGQVERLQRLERERGELRSRVQAARSQRAEAEALAAEGAGQEPAAAAKWEEALQLHREAYAHRTRVDAAENAREARLASRADDARAAGLQRTIERERERAERAEVAENWTEAAEAYAALRAAQSAINERMPASRFADPRALTRIEGALATTRTAGAAAIVVKSERAAEAAERSGTPAVAAAAIQAALQAQQSINTNFPTSRHASAERARELEGRWQSLASAEGLARAAQLAAEAAGLLRERAVPAAEDKVTLALRTLEETMARYPRSRRLDAALRRQLAFLDLRRGEIAGLQQSVLEMLLPLPGRPAVRLLATEVPQRLYEKVMNHNPSHHRGPRLPVECVSWPEAAAFCERAGWLLGRPVRLPTEDEFRAAFTLPQAAARQLTAAGAHSRPVPAAGHATGRFSDLAGNVAEWLAPGAPATAPLASGSYLQAALANDLPFTQEPKARRAPHIGFRFVVE